MVEEFASTPELSGSITAINICVRKHVCLYYIEYFYVDVYKEVYSRCVLQIVDMLLGTRWHCLICLQIKTSLF
jgi:hypothetical protein